MTDLPLPGWSWDGDEARKGGYVVSVQDRVSRRDIVSRLKVGETDILIGMASSLDASNEELFLKLAALSETVTTVEETPEGLPLRILEVPETRYIRLQGSRGDGSRPVQRIPDGKIQPKFNKRWIGPDTPVIVEDPLTLQDLRVGHKFKLPDDSGTVWRLREDPPLEGNFVEASCEHRGTHLPTALPVRPLDLQQYLVTEWGEFGRKVDGTYTIVSNSAPEPIQTGLIDEYRICEAYTPIWGSWEVFVACCEHRQRNDNTGEWELWRRDAGNLAWEKADTGITNGTYPRTTANDYYSEYEERR